MRTLNLGTLVLSLAALTACTIGKGGDESTGSSSGSASEATDGDVSASSTGSDLTTTATDGIVTTSATDISTGGDLTTSATDGDPTGGEGNLPCIDTPTVLAADEASPLGFSGAALLADKLGERETSLTFFNEPTTLSDQWKSKVLPLTVALRHEGGEIRFIDSEVNPDYDDSGNESGFDECTDRIEVDVKFDFVTEAGEFDEHRDAVLIATTVERADLRAELMPPGIMGSLDPAGLYSDPEWVVESVQIGAIWQGELAGGSLLNQVQIGEGEGASVGFGSIAEWGDEELGGF
jgi:hypothetical protein